MAAAMPVYDLNRLMEETRRVAAEFRRTTGDALPVTPEIARHDAIQLLQLNKPEVETAGLDAWMLENGREIPCIIKGRAIFDEGRSGYRLGSINPDQPWERILLVLLDDDYATTEIYALDKAVALEAGIDLSNPRGPMTVAKFKSIGRLLWDRWHGKSDDELLANTDR